MWSASIDGRRLRFHLAGINNENFLMQDEATGSWWQQASGEAVAGPMKGRRLQLIGCDELSFALWRGEQPNGRVLVPVPGAPWERFSRGWEESTARLPVVSLRPVPAILPARELVVGVTVGGAAKAYPLSALRRQSPILDRIGGVPVAVVLGDDRRSVRAFRTEHDGRPLTLFAQPGSPLRLLDSETGSTWSFAGEAVGGPLAGSRLATLAALQDYWFDWYAYHPGTELYRLGPR